MNYRCGGFYGVNEAILASAIAALAFSLLSVQPLTIVGVTGLINLFNYTTYDILKQTGPEINYLQFQAWVLIWSAITHWLVAMFNVCDYTRFITDCTSETFGFYVGVIYIQKGIELLILEFKVSSTAGWFSVVVAIVFALFVYFFERIGSLPFGPFQLRKWITDYAFAIAIVLFTGLVHIPGEIEDSGIEFLQITRSFAPSTEYVMAGPEGVCQSLPLRFKSRLGRSFLGSPSEVGLRCPALWLSRYPALLLRCKVSLFLLCESN
ncbi:hypothetical protein P7C70_g5839, partial [Phenoliferia sp. Uapishka_3]